MKRIIEILFVVIIAAYYCCLGFVIGQGQWVGGYRSVIISAVPLIVLVAGAYCDVKTNRMRTR